MITSVVGPWTISLRWLPSPQDSIPRRSVGLNELGNKLIRDAWLSLEHARWPSTVTKTLQNTGSWWPQLPRHVFHLLVSANHHPAAIWWLTLHPGVFLSTLQFIQDGNPDNLPGGLVNFRKRQKASEVISDIKRWQAQPFNFQSVPSILAYIDESLGQFSDTRASSEHFWSLSLEREPREREDEKMARLLQESGFL